MKKQIILCICIFGFFFMSTNSSAQVMYHPNNKPTKKEKELDASIQTCITEDSSLDKKFSLAEWSATLHYYTRKLVQRLSSEHVGKIAAQKPAIKALYELLENCKALNSIKAELTSIYQIYEKQIIIEENAESTGVFEDTEVKAKIEKKDAENIVKKLEKLQKKLNITRRVVRIDE